MSWDPGADNRMLITCPDPTSKILLDLFEVNLDAGTGIGDGGEQMGNEPELYSFEDYVPLTPITPPASSTENEADVFSISTESLSSKGRELQRSKTLPIIRVPKLAQNEASQDTEPSLPPPLYRKQSVPVITVQRPGKTSPDCLYREGGSKRKFSRSKSCERRKSASRSRSPQDTHCSAWNFDDDTDSTTSSETMTTCSDDVSSARRSSTQLFYTTPPKANMVRTQDDKRSARRSSNHKADVTKLNGRQRSVSLDCGDGRMVKMLTSESDNLQNIQKNKQMLRASPSDPGTLLRSNGYPSPGRPPRTPMSSHKKRGSISSTDTDSSSPGKYERKRFSKDARSYDIVALFDAVEHQDIDAVKEILETNGLDINSVNSEFLTPLDVAVMTNNIPMAKMLLSHGARESPLFQRAETRSTRLDILVSEAERRVVDLTAAVLNGSSGSSSVSSAQQKENERQLSHWEFRHKLLKRMKAGYDHARCPDAPTNVSLSISNSNSLLVKFGEPLNRNGAVVTKYKVEWSKFESFSPLAGEVIVEDVRTLEKEIKGLEKGTAFYVRVAAMNMKGYSTYANSSPPYGVPSSWRDVEEVLPRCHGKLKILEELFAQVKQLRPADAPEIKDTPGSSSPVQRKKKGFKNLFSSAPKFQKCLKRGVYLSSFFYTEDKVLVTSEEQLPIVEVDENFTSPSVHSELCWLMKVACTWDDIKSLRQDMDKSTSEAKVHFRGKLLQAVSLLQNALGTHDLGQFYYKPLRDPNGSIVLTTVSFIRDPKVITLGSCKWVPLTKLQRRQSASMTDFPEAQDCLVSALHDMTLYDQTSAISLAPGLYLGYLKLHASVELLRVLVSQKSPNVLPNVRVRDCPNVSREEWDWLKKLNSDQLPSSPTNNQQTFQTSLAKASKKLFKLLDISEEAAASHRLYNLEVIEMSPQVSFLLVLPPSEEVCIIPGQSDEVMDRDDFVLLPVQVFEMIHMNTYQNPFISRYSRLSSILEMDIILAQQSQREAFSKEELNLAKERVFHLCKLQQELDQAYKGMRWIMDIITYARARTLRGGIPLTFLSSSIDDSSLSTELEHRSKILENNNSLSPSSVSCNSNEMSVGKDNRKIANFYDPNEDTSQPANGHVTSHVTSRSRESSAHSSHTDSSGILRVYAAYETGLARGTSVKLHVTPKTTAREVINLVVCNLNQAVVNKGKQGPIYSEDQFTDFCLVAVIGARERILRDDYQPLQLQNPWTKGRLFVRMRNNLLAAIQQGHATTV